MVNENNNKTSCHPGGFTDGRRVNECEPSPVSEQIEHTKTECLYAKLCEREVNPRQFISGSYQSCDSTHSRSNSEHTSQNAKELLEEGKVSKKKTVTINLFIFYTFISFSFFTNKRERNEPKKEKTTYIKTASIVFIFKIF